MKRKEHGIEDFGKAISLYFFQTSFCYTCRKIGITLLAAAAAKTVLFQVINNVMVASVLGFLMCVRMLMHATAHGGSMNTVTRVRESALKANTGKQIA